MDFTELEDLFWQMTTDILGAEFNPDNIRLTYPIDGQPGWKIDEDIVFIRLFEREDTYDKQIDSIYKPERGTVIKKSARTRVWEVQYVVYGPMANTNSNKIKDGVFRQDVKRYLAGNGVFLVPDLPLCRRIPELFAGQWWNRWDVSLTFNELYHLDDENVGRIESVSITTQTNR